MKGVILSSAPRATLVDLCHGIAPQDVRGGAFALRAGVPYFPAGTLFVCVVDPGVGSDRRVLWARTARHRFLAPDNGLLSWLREPPLEIRSVENRALGLAPLSATFHGRDIFAAVAGRLAAGLAAGRLGPRVAGMARIPFPRPRREGGRLVGEILHLDRFGNAVASLGSDDVRACRWASFRGRRLPLLRHYAQVRSGRPVALIGSSGQLELSVRDGNFARAFKARPGDAIHAGL